MCLFQGIVHIYSVIACVMNVRMAFIILFSALGSQSGVDTLIGSQSQNEFIQSQYASWICLAIATLFSVVLGILAVVWLVKIKRTDKSALRRGDLGSPIISYVSQHTGFRKSYSKEKEK